MGLVANWQRFARMALIVLPVRGRAWGSRRVGGVLHAWRSLCCQFAAAGPERFVQEPSQPAKASIMPLASGPSGYRIGVVQPLSM